MGGSKDAWMEHEGLVAQARRIAVKSGWLKRCHLHGIAYENGIGSPDVAYAYANIALQRGEVKADRQSFMDAMKDALKDVPFECYICDRALSKD